MNLGVVLWLLGQICWLLAGAMIVSLPWSFPIFGEVSTFDYRGFFGLLSASLLTAGVGAILAFLGHRQREQPLYRKEAMAVVGLGWILASLVGALPYLLSGTALGRDRSGMAVPMTLVDAIFESVSGFTNTGASVLTDVEDRELVPRSVLFWRSETHFIGGLGIIVLFVAVLGVGSASKALMQSEIPALVQTRTYALSQHSARAFGSIYVGLTVILAIILMLAGLRPFDALCHAFGTVATGGFSTRNASVAGFGSWPIELIITVFMILASTNFVLLYHVVLFGPGRLLSDPEFRTYLTIISVSILAVTIAGLSYGDFPDLATGLRHGVFQVTAIISTTGFTVVDFDKWNSFSQAILLTTMFIGGCACSTSGSLKIIRYILLGKILSLELEKMFRPNVIRHIRLGKRVIQEPEIRVQILLYFALSASIFVLAWLALVAVESDRVWRPGNSRQWHSEIGLAMAGTQEARSLKSVQQGNSKLTDCASAVATCLNGVGPGLGMVGPSKNYAHLQLVSKFILCVMMLFGRLEVFPILVLFSPRFWRRL
jgi:trk system potassium uptake protein TrkH